MIVQILPKCLVAESRGREYYTADDGRSLGARNVVSGAERALRVAARQNASFIQRQYRAVIGCAATHIGKRIDQRAAAVFLVYSEELWYK